MVKILEGDLQEQWYLQKDFDLNYLHKLKSQLKFEIEKFIITLNEQFC
ncbi:unnamed protein product [Paramecium pentaurelia]|uniref:Uncharacterized protein n=1 Tax=Paramecium pentaurelia TaxID=43138 RepID=A0A8S1YID9_9CILI|nr:unnamed protein product [Paramecium pentaurelia]